MQKITTREPEPAMIEVAIKSLQGVLDKEAAEARCRGKLRAARLIALKLTPTDD